MYISVTFLFVVLGCVITSLCGNGRFITFVPNDALDGYQCQDDDVMVFKIYKNPGRRLDCLLRCSTNKACSSVFVSKDACLVCRKKYNATTELKVADAGGTKYFELIGVGYHGTCNEDEQCAGKNRTCLLDQCVCTIGYSYDYNSQACVEHCEKYGRTFQKYPNQRLRDLYIRHITDVNQTECLEMCWEIFDNICYSVDYNMLGQKCRIFNATALSHNYRLKNTQNFNHYTRNCEN